MPATQLDLTKHTFVYKKASSIEIKLDLLLPTSPSAPSRAALPIFYWHHGGGAIQGRREAVPPHIKHAANTHNFAIVSPDYRLAPQVRWPAIAEDLVDAFKFAVDELTQKAAAAGAPKLDADNILVSGSSVGGFLALSLGLGLCPTLALSDAASAKYLQRIRGLPLIYPITNWDAPFWADPQEPFKGYLPDAELHDPAFKAMVDPSAPVIANTDPEAGVPALRNKFYMYAQQTAPVTGFQQLVFGEALLKDGWLQRSNTVRHVAEQAQQIKHVLGEGARIYAVHGEKDTAVAVSQARTLRDAADKAGIPLEYEEIKGTDHLFDYEASVTLDEFWAWCAKAWKL